MARRILRKPFYPLEEICERWEMSAEDLAPFVLDGELKLSIPAAGLWVSVGEWVEDESGKRARSPSRTVSIRGPLDLEASDAWWAIRKGSTRIESFAAGGNQYIDVFSGSDPSPILKCFVLSLWFAMTKWSASRRSTRC